MDPIRAADLHTAFVQDTFLMLEAFRQEADVELSTDAPTEAWPDLRAARSVQVEGDLGKRMYATLERALGTGRPKAIIVGSDSPLLPQTHIRRLLQSAADIVIGPTEDGGYYAIACRKVAPEMFEGVRWSTTSTLADTVSAARRCGLTCEVGASWFDVDRPEDLERLRQMLVCQPRCGRAVRLLEAMPPRCANGPFFLDADDVQTLGVHLRKLSWTCGGQVLSAERIGDGNMNLTIRVRTDRQSFILKQARPWVEKYPHIPAPVERAAVEATFYRIASPRPALAAHMPRFLGFDGDANLLALEDLGERCDLTTLYRGGGLSLEACCELVDYLSALHEVTPRAEEFDTLRNRRMRLLNHEHQYVLPLRRDNGLDLDRITPGLAAQAADLRSDAEYCTRVADLGSRYLADGLTLVHGDFFPGSWLHTERGLAVIDPEFCFLGPREYDLGVFLAHLVFIGAQSLWQLVEMRYKGDSDWLLARRFAGAEIMRRLIGVAQLPIAAGIDTKRAWLELSKSLVRAE